MKYVLRIVSIVVVASALTPAAELRAQLDGSSNATPHVAPRDGVLVLKNGHVLVGRITWSGDHYFVDRGGLQMGVRAAEVITTAADLDDAYRQQRDELSRTDLDGHQTLAQWCLRHDLLGYAATQLAECTALHPRHRRTEALMRQLQSAVRVAENGNGSGNGSGNDTADAALRPSDDATQVVDTTPANSDDRTDDRIDGALDELSDRTVESFVTRIQPLLINQCASGGCHGGASSAELQFQRFDPRKSPSRVYTERNLAAALKFVDRERPDASPLLVAPSQPHGSAKTPIFAARTLGHQAELAAWIRLAARDANIRIRGEKSAQDRAQANNTPAVAPSSVSRATYERQTPAERDNSVSPQSPATRNPNDPDVFNRRFFPAGRPENPPSPLPTESDPRAAPRRQPPSDAPRPSLAEDDIPPFQSIEERDVTAEQPR